mmetsp:Transcript_7422/g.6656  ORF Transcript_7422/g.6656 Transcript_7422/m.6656 type:complete len:233 (-) Transcript_7422:547-1245(-)
MIRELLIIFIILLEVLVNVKTFKCHIAKLNKRRTYSSSNPSLSFDADFAESVSKPLPEWFIEQEIARKKLQDEIDEKKRLAVEEFKAKYMITDKSTFKRRNKNTKSKSKSFWSVFINSKESVLDNEEVNNEELTTKEKWDNLAEEEKETTGFYLPGLFEVFPELKFKWPLWAKKNGKTIKCTRDEDCQFPQTCCAHPIIPGDRFCCTGWGQRVMVPAYAPQFIKPDIPEKSQ